MGKQLTAEGIQYIKERGFVIVEKLPIGKPYLFLGPEPLVPNAYAYGLGFFKHIPTVKFCHRFHTGGFESDVHPNNAPLEDILYVIEQSIVGARNHDDFAIPAGEPIPVVVNDPAWDAIVKLLVDKYKI